jgi:2'-hydroxyisoflavone reductase
LWDGAGQDGWALAADPAAAFAAGLAPRPLADTIADTLAWVRQAGYPPAGTGLTAAQEEQLLSLA